MICICLFLKLAQKINIKILSLNADQDSTKQPEDTPMGPIYQKNMKSMFAGRGKFLKAKLLQPNALLSKTRH